MEKETVAQHQDQYQPEKKLRAISGVKYICMKNDDTPYPSYPCFTKAGPRRHYPS